MTVSLVLMALCILRKRLFVLLLLTAAFSFVFSLEEYAADYFLNGTRFGLPKCAFRSDEELRFLNLMGINGS